MADLFTLVGTIAIDAEQGKQEIDNVTASAKGLADVLDDTSSGANQTSKAFGKNSKLSSASVYWGNLMAGVTEAGVKFLMKLPPAAVKAAAGVDAEVAAFEATFGEMASAATESYEQISADTNILFTRLRSVGTKGYAQLKGAGLSANEALEESDKLLRLAADAAAYYDISLEDADAKLRSFMRGNTEAGDAIGLFTSANQREIVAAELYGQKWLDLTEAQRQYMMLDVARKIYEDAGVIGQATRESEEWTNVTANWSEAQLQSLATIGTPIKDALLPALNDLTSWLADNETQEKLNGLADALGKIAGVAFDGMTTAFEWLMDNGEAIGVALGVIGAGLAIGAIAAHPYAAAVLAVAAALGALSQMSQEAHTQTEILHDELQGYSQEEYDLVNNLIKANNEAVKGTGTWDAVDLADEKLRENARALELFNKYSELKKWDTSMWEGLEEGMMPEIPVEASVSVAEGSEEDIQAVLNGMEFSAVVKMVADTTDLSTLQGIAAGGGEGADGSHASGLDRVPFDGYRAILHKDEAVLRASEAAVWRGEKRGVGTYGNSGQVVNVTQNISAVPMSTSELIAETKFALSQMRFAT